MNRKTTWILLLPVFLMAGEAAFAANNRTLEYRRGASVPGEQARQPLRKDRGRLQGEKIAAAGQEARLQAAAMRVQDGSMSASGKSRDRVAETGPSTDPGTNTMLVVALGVALVSVIRRMGSIQ